MKPFLLSLIGLSLAAQAPAPEIPQSAPRAWSNVTTLSYVATTGNAKGQTVGFGNEFLYKWGQSVFSLKARAIRVNTTVVTRSATGTSLEDYVVAENRTSTTTAETYGLNGRFDHRLKDKDRWYWYGGAGWEKNRPAGLDNKYSATTGFGRIWADQDRTKFRTDVGFGYTHEQPLVTPVDFQANYGTVNFTSQFKQRVGANSLYTMDLAFTGNLSESRDYQGVLRQGFSVAINKSLALKVGYDMVYKNKPNLIPVEVFTVALPPLSLGSISVPAKKTDTVFTTSLVITF